MNVPDNVPNNVPNNVPVWRCHAYTGEVSHIHRGSRPGRRIGEQPPWGCGYPARGRRHRDVLRDMSGPASGAQLADVGRFAVSRVIVPDEQATLMIEAWGVQAIKVEYATAGG